MGTHYRHLTEQDRIFIRIMLDKEYSKDKIADILKVHRSTIYREVKRNSSIHQYNGLTFYWSHLAQKKALARRKRPCKLDNDPVLKAYVHSKLKTGWSPWQIEGRLKRENGGHSNITHETIYRYIYSRYDIRNKLYMHLRRKRLLRQKMGQRRHWFKGTSIDMRPQEINSRKKFGHWEGDLMLFHKKTKVNLITLRERKSRFIVAIKNENKSTDKTMINIISTLKSLKRHVDSITFDLGSEFAKHILLKECLGADIYFCDPGKPHQKGSIENGNGVIRCELPRTSDIDSMSQQKIDHLITMINNRPLKCLGYMTPKEVFELHTLEYKKDQECSLI